MRKEYFKSKDKKSYNENNNQSKKNESKKNILIIPYRILYTISKYALLVKLLFESFFTTEDIIKY